MQFDKAGIGVNIGMLEGNNLAKVLAAPTLVALSGRVPASCRVVRYPFLCPLAPAWWPFSTSPMA